MSDEILPRELARRLAAGDDIFLLDVREPAEADICRIEGSTLIPLGILPLRVGELPRERDIVVYCKMGARSAQAARFLQSHGFRRVENLMGGILGWIDDVDGSLKRY